MKKGYPKRDAKMGTASVKIVWKLAYIGQASPHPGKTLKVLYLVVKY